MIIKDLFVKFSNLRKGNLNLFLIKIICSFYNIAVIYILSRLENQNISGEIVYILSMMGIVSMVSRLGSDNYWLDSKLGSIRMVKNELIIGILMTFIAGVILGRAIEKVYFGDNIDIVIYIIIIISGNCAALASKINQGCGFHSSSLLLQLLGGGFLAVPLVIVGIENILLAALISYLWVLAYSLIIIMKKGRYVIEQEGYAQRFHYIPNNINGIINQNYIIIFGKMLDSLTAVPVLVFYQKLFGLVGWPVAIYLQKKTPELSGLVRTKKFEIFKILKPIFMITIGLFIFTIMVLICIKIMSSRMPDTLFFSATLILFGVASSALTSIFPIIYGLKRSGVSQIIIAILASLISMISLLVGGNSDQIISLSFGLYQFAFLCMMSLYWLNVVSKK